MTIEIHKPELEALIIERLKNTGFETIEDVLMQALQSSPLPARKTGATGADLIAAMQASPYREIEIQPDRDSWGAFSFFYRNPEPPEPTGRVKTGSSPLRGSE